MGKENDTDNPKKRRKSISTSTITWLKDGDMYKVNLYYVYQKQYLKKKNCNIKFYCVDYNHQ